MVVGILKLGLVLYSPGSLKEKRGIVQKILGRIRSRFPVSAAEVGQQELYQRAELGISMVHGSEVEIRRQFAQIEEVILATALADILESDIEVLHENF